MLAACGVHVVAASFSIPTDHALVHIESALGVALTDHAQTAVDPRPRVNTARERPPIVYFFSRGGRQITNRGAEVFHQLHHAVRREGIMSFLEDGVDAYATHDSQFIQDYDEVCVCGHVCVCARCAVCEAREWCGVCGCGVWVSVCCSVGGVCIRVGQGVVVCCSVLQCVAVYCSVLQCIAMCCRVLQCVAVFCIVLQCVRVCAAPLVEYVFTTHCNTLQHTATHCTTTHRRGDICPSFSLCH